MANTQHLEILRKGIKVWNKWRKEHPDIQPDLIRARLSSEDLRGAILSNADLDSADLSKALCARADFSHSNLCAADLSQADFRKASCFGSDFDSAELFKADFRNAHLSRANFINASVQEVDFSGAGLSNANFTGAELLDANLHDCYLESTIFAGNDLSEVQGLQTVYHAGPSIIGFDTLYRSGGQIPEVFLRGCGVPEELIELMPSLTNKPFDYYSCFISYSHDDKAFARRLHDALQGRGIRCWLDEHQLLPGDDIYERVDQGIRLWDKVLLCCSEASLKSWWVDNEIDKAFKKEQALMKAREKKVWALIPLNIDGFLFQWENGKADQVRSRLAADFTGWKRSHKKFETQLERIVKSLQTNDAGREVPPESKL